MNLLKHENIRLVEEIEAGKHYDENLSTLISINDKLRARIYDGES